jgi:hypothetical protein
MLALSNGPGTIPTAQALLLFSAQNCGKGNLTQAWLYSGMAFRLIEHQGIVMDGRRYGGNVHLSAEDIEIRNRLFWSAYVWDKFISLYLGRVPTLQSSSASPPHVLLDDSAETELWVPQGIDALDGVQYLPTQAYSTSSFIKFCELAEILSYIQLQLYNPTRPCDLREMDECINKQSKALAYWHENLGDNLRMNTTHLPSQSPPGHIVTLNCAYHMVSILLHRPILASQHGNLDTPQYSRCLQECVRSASAIIVFFELLVRTFGYAHIGLSTSYTVYTAATIFLLQIQVLKHSQLKAEESLEYCLLALERLKVGTPGEALLANTVSSFLLTLCQIVIGLTLSLIYREVEQQKLLQNSLLLEKNWPEAVMSQPRQDTWNGLSVIDSSNIAGVKVPNDQSFSWDPAVNDTRFTQDFDLTEDMFNTLTHTEFLEHPDVLGFST